jgi:hypothetical protein
MPIVRQGRGSGARRLGSANVAPADSANPPLEPAHLGTEDLSAGPPATNGRAQSLDHVEGRSWYGLRAFMTAIAHTFLQLRRLAAATWAKKSTGRSYVSENPLRAFELRSPADIGKLSFPLSRSSFRDVRIRIQESYNLVALKQVTKRAQPNL